MARKQKKQEAVTGGCISSLDGQDHQKLKGSEQSSKVLGSRGQSQVER